MAKIPDAYRWMFCAFYLFNAIVGIVCNVVTLITFWRERRSSWFHIQLCITNIISLIATTLSSPSALRGGWLFGKNACRWYGFQTSSAENAELLFTCAVCIETMIAICKQHKYERLGKRFYIIPSVCIWTYCLIFAIFPLYGWNRYIVDRNSVSCGLDVRFYSPSTSSYIQVIGSVILLGVVTSIGCLVWTTLNKPREESQSFAPLFTDKQLLKITIGLFTVLFVCSLPMNLRIVGFIRKDVPLFSGFLTVEFSKFCLKLACCLQPFVYLTFSTGFKGLVISIFTGVTPEKKNS